MIKWYLVLYILGQGSAISVMPIAYSSEQECQKAAEPWGNSFRCIKGPDREDKGYVCEQGASQCSVVKK